MDEMKLKAIINKVIAKVPKTRAELLAFARKPVMLSLFALLALFLLLDNVFPFRPNIQYSQIILAKDGTVVDAFLSSDQKWRMKTELNEISPRLRDVFVAKEDRWFYWHCGINPIAIVRAGVGNILHAQRQSGASTITMQVARLLEPKSRTLWSKVKECFRALQLEVHYSKNEILQMYINLVPYGGNIEGVKAASVLYFDRLPQQLSLAQLTTLAIVPNRPTSLRLGAQSDEIIKERQRWIRKFRQKGICKDDEANDACLEMCQIQRCAIAHLAPHLATRLRQRFSSNEIVHSTVDAAIQQKCATLCFNYSQRMKLLGVHNCAAIVVNNQTHNVEAYVGSPDFLDAQHGGQCDGVQAIRSPGSALKPYLYAMAIDAGIVTPKTVVNDVPTHFDDYAPENYDQQFHGPVTVEEALAQSLNIPAVSILDKVGVQNFTQKLIQAGFRSIKTKESALGLSLALGGCGVRLEEMARLYSSFACAGKVHAVHWTLEDQDTSSIQLMSPAAAFMISSMLCNLTRPDLPSSIQSSLHIPRIAWKTGTSYGRRDAWSIGFNNHYTVAIWVGNFDGQGNPDLSGAASATPLLFEIFNTLDYNSTDEWNRAPADVDYRIVCSESGLVPSDDCDKTLIDYFIPTVSSAQSCQHIQEVCVSADSKTSFCSSCKPSTGTKSKKYHRYSPELLVYYKSEHTPIDLPPRHNPKCSRILHEDAPVINSPLSGKQYLIDRREELPMKLACAVPADVDVVYWYLNDKLICEAAPYNSVFVKPARGKNKISCCDDKGRNRDIFVHVDWQ